MHEKAADRSRGRDLSLWALGWKPAGGSVYNGLESCFVFSGSAETAFPNCKDAPAGIQKFLYVDLVAFTVALELVFPPLTAGSRQFGQPASVIVPETTVDEDDSSVPGKHEVWPAGKVTDMQTVAKT